MPIRTRLETSDRGFFRKVSEAAFANPFGKDRTELDLKIAGRPQGDQNGLLG